MEEKNPKESKKSERKDKNEQQKFVTNINKRTYT